MNYKILFLLLFHLSAYSLDSNFLQVYFYLSSSEGSGQGLLSPLLSETQRDFEDPDLSVTADAIVCHNILIEDARHEIYNTTFLAGIFVYKILDTGCYLLTRYSEENKDKKSVVQDFNEYGYRYEKLKFISNLREFYKKQKESFWPINMENLSPEKLFSVFDKSNINRVFCLRGHSSFDFDNFLGMQLNSFMQVMAELSQLEPIFILIASCYASGERSLVLCHPDCYKDGKRPNFPIFTVGLNDHTIVGRSYFYFCCRLIKYLKNKRDLSELYNNENREDKIYVKALFPEDSEPKLLQLPGGYIQLDFFNEQICITQNQRINVYINAVGATESFINTLSCPTIKKADIVKIFPIGICCGKKSPSFIFIKKIICTDGKINNIAFLSFSKSDKISFVYQDEEKYFGSFSRYKPLGRSYDNKLLTQTEFIDLINQMISLCKPSAITEKYDLDHGRRASLVINAVNQALSEPSSN